MSRARWFLAGMAASVAVGLALDVIFRAVPTDDDVWGKTADDLCRTCGAPVYYERGARG